MDTTKKLEEIFDLKISDEQNDILKNNFDVPTLINACAGAGKTTLLEWIIVSNAMKGTYLPQDTLCVTFSKNSQLDMLKKYNKVIEKVEANGVMTFTWGTPRFTTFHALFFRLLRMYPIYADYRVVTSYNEIGAMTGTGFSLSNAIKHRDDTLTPQEQLDEIFNVHDTLINKQYSLDGINLNANNSLVKKVVNAYRGTNDFRNVLAFTTGRTDEEFFENYVSVVKTYVDLKAKHKLLDFNDMAVLLLGLVKKNPEVFRNAMSKWKIAFIDEFQDINPLQWNLIKRLLSDETFNRLVVVGDDDQSIYSFRGSEADFILKYDKLQPDVKVFPLSTNYRTGGNILNVAKTEIAQNKLRLGKDLLAFNNGVGEVYVNRKQDLLFDVESKSLNFIYDKYVNTDEEGLILVRYNRDTRVILDWLTGKGVVLNPGRKSNILQNDTYYKMYIGLLKAFYTNDLDLLVKHSNRIGFSTFKNWMENMTKRLFKDGKKHTITEFVNGVDMNIVRSSDWKISKNFNTIYRLHQSITSWVGKITLKSAFQEICSATDYYANFMLEKKFWRKEEYDVIFDYIGGLVAYNPTKSETENLKFFEFEEEKQKTLENALNENRVKDKLRVMTLHSSKGLEADYVLLYGLTDESLNGDVMEIVKHYPSDMTYQYFLSDLKNDPKWIVNNVVLLMNAHISSAYRFEMMMRRNKNMDIQLNPQNVNWELLKMIQTEKGLQPEYIEANDVLPLLYQEIKALAKFVEEERRLLYVGVTRAKKDLVIEMSGTHDSPLLYELDLSQAKSFASSNE